MEGMRTWLLPAVRQAVRWMQEGRIGRLRHVQADFGYPQLPFDARRREYAAGLDGGCLLEMGVYPVAFSHLFQQADPVGIKVTARRAPNGVEDDLVAVLEFPGSTSTLATSFRCKLRNWAYVIGEEGYIAIPDFWRPREALHFQLDRCVERFDDGRESLGFDFEIAAVGDDLLAGRKQSSVVPLASSLKFQEHMDLIRRAGRSTY